MSQERALHSAWIPWITTLRLASSGCQCHLIPVPRRPSRSKKAGQAHRRRQSAAAKPERTTVLGNQTELNRRARHTEGPSIQARQVNPEERYANVIAFIGAGESGKSTILKQMKLIHEGGYTRDERESFKEIIFSNTVQSMRVILEAMESLELPLDDTRMEYHVNTIFMQPQQIEGESLPAEVGHAIKELWKDEGVQLCFVRSREYQLNDSAK